MCPSFRAFLAACPEAALNPLLDVSEPVEVMKALGAGEEALMWAGGMDRTKRDHWVPGCMAGYGLTSTVAYSPTEVVMSEP